VRCGLGRGIIRLADSVLCFTTFNIYVLTEEGS
jgi:hypothetical protein